MAKAQAAKVFAVDGADILYNATDNFRYELKIHYYHYYKIIKDNLVKIILDD